jgi:hypothetical protein
MKQNASRKCQFIDLMEYAVEVLEQLSNDCGTENVQIERNIVV